MVKILVVDDDKELRETVQGILQKKHQVEVAKNVKDATEKLQHGRFDVVLADYHLPDGTGADLIGEANGQQAKLAIMSGALSASERADLERRGVTTFLTKGDFTANILEHTVRGALKTKRGVA